MVECANANLVIFKCLLFFVVWFLVVVVEEFVVRVFNGGKVFIFSVVTIENVKFMSTIQVEEEIKRQLFSIAAELQSKRGKKTSLSEAIRHLINFYLYQKRDVPRMLSLFGCLGSEPKAKAILKELRAKEEERLEGFKRQYCA